MALPADVSTFRFSFGPYFKDDGSPDYVGMTGTVRPSKSRYHATSGGAFSTTADSITIGSDGTATSQVHPHSDVATLSPETFYIVEWDTDSPRSPSPGNKRVYVPAVMGVNIDYDGLTLIDSDLQLHVPVLVDASIALQAVAAALDAANSAAAAAVSAALAASATKADLVAGHVPDAQLPGRLSDTSLKAAYAPGARPNTLIPFGTSITNLDNYGGPQYATGTTARGYMAWANAIGGHRWRIVRNAGISGNNSAQMLARLQTDVLAYAPGYCVVESGTPNDIGSAFTLATSIANHKAIYDQLKAAGIRVVVCTPLPYGLADTTANRQFISALRKWMITYAREQGHLLCDWHAVVAASDGSGLWPVGWSDGATNGQNGVHPMAPAAKAMGVALAATLRYEKADFAGLWLPGSNADPYNLLLNGMMTGTGGTPSPAGVTNSGLATSWGAYNNGGTSAGTLSKVARTDGVAGEWQQFQATAGNADGIKLQQQNTAVGTAWNVGDTVLAISEWQADADWVGGLDLSLTLSFYNTGNVQTELFRPSADIGIGQPPSSGVHMVSGVVPAATSRLQVNPYVRMGAGGTVRWGRTGLYNLTQLAALGIMAP